VSYYTLNETPNFFLFVAKPRASNWPKQLARRTNNAITALVKGYALMGVMEQMAKKPNLEIEQIRLSINTSSNVLQNSEFTSLDRVEMDRMTLYNCQSLSGFPYDRQAFRKYRHFVLARVEDFSGIFASPGVADPMTLQGHVRVCNNLDAAIAAA
jgi:hypothetical protein